MKFKSPAVERTLTRLSQSVAGGILIPACLLLLLMLTAAGDSERPLLEAYPFAYILAWPFLLWKHILSREAAELATVVSHNIIYSLLTYRFIRWHESLKRLP